MYHFTVIFFTDGIQESWKHTWVFFNDRKFCDQKWQNVVFAMAVQFILSVWRGEPADAELSI